MNFKLWVETRVAAQTAQRVLSDDPIVRIMNLRVSIGKGYKWDGKEIDPEARKSSEVDWYSLKFFYERDMIADFGFNRKKPTLFFSDKETSHPKSRMLGILHETIRQRKPVLYNAAMALAELEEDGITEKGESQARHYDQTVYMAFRPKGWKDTAVLKLGPNPGFFVGVSGGGDAKDSVSFWGQFTSTGNGNLPQGVGAPNEFYTSVKRAINANIESKEEASSRGDQKAINSAARERAREDGWKVIRMTHVTQNPEKTLKGIYYYRTEMEKLDQGITMYRKGDVIYNANEDTITDATGVIYHATWDDIHVTNVDNYEKAKQVARNAAKLYRQAAGRLNFGKMFYFSGFDPNKKNVSKMPQLNLSRGNNYATPARDISEAISKLDDWHKRQSNASTLSVNEQGEITTSPNIDALIDSFNDNRFLYKMMDRAGLNGDPISAIKAFIFGASAPVQLLEASQTMQRAQAVLNRIEPTIGTFNPLSEIKRAVANRSPNVGDEKKMSQFDSQVSKWLMSTILRKLNADNVMKILGNDPEKEEIEVIKRVITNTIKSTVETLPDIVWVAAEYYASGQPEEFAPAAREVISVIRQNNTSLADLTRINAEYHRALIQQKAKAGPTRGTEVIHTFKDGSKWRLFDRGGCRDEGLAGSHCGNGAGRPGDRILSLRDKKEKVSATFIYNNGELREAKGWGNQKPAAKVHPQIVWLLSQKSPMGGDAVKPIKPIEAITSTGYLPANDFHPDDLDKELFDKLDKARPDLYWRGKKG